MDNCSDFSTSGDVSFSPTSLVCTREEIGKKLGDDLDVSSSKSSLHFNLNIRHTKKCHRCRKWFDGIKFVRNNKIWKICNVCHDYSLKHKTVVERTIPFIIVKYDLDKLFSIFADNVVLTTNEAYHRFKDICFGANYCTVRVYLFKLAKLDRIFYRRLNNRVIIWSCCNSLLFGGVK